MRNLKKISGYLALPGIIALGIVWRVVRLGYREYMGRDELYYLEAAMRLGDSTSSLQGQYTQPFFLPVILKYLTPEGAGIEDYIYTADCLNLCLSAGAIALAWKLGKILTGTARGGLVVALVFAFFPMAAKLSIEILRESGGLFFYLLSLVFLLQALQSNRKRFWFGAGISIALGMGFRVEMMELFTLPLFYYAVFYRNLRGKIKEILLNLLVFATGFGITAGAVVAGFGLSGNYYFHTYFLRYWNGL